MLSRRAWSAPAIWLAIVTGAMVCALFVIELAFESSALAFSAEPSRLAADYSADPRDAHMLTIAPVESAVISDTLRDLAFEQASNASPTTQPAGEQPAATPRPSHGSGNAAKPSERPAAPMQQESAPTPTPPDQSSLEPTPRSGGTSHSSAGTSAPNTIPL